MDQIRILLWAALLTLLWLGFNQWFDDYGAPPPPPQVEAPQDDPTLPAPAPLPDVTDELPAGPVGPNAEVSQTQSDTGVAAPVRVRTDVLDIVIDARGGDIVRADLLEYPVSKDSPDELVRLLDYQPATRWVFQTGVRDVRSDNGPTHLAMYTSRQNSYELAGDRSELIVTLDWDDGNGLSAHKTYTFHRGSYAVDLDVQILNESGSAWNAMPYLQMLRQHIARDRSFLDVDSYSYTGPVLYDGESRTKLDVEDLVEEPISADVYTNGWLASIQHHFLAAAVPPAEESYTFSATSANERYLLTARGPTRVVPTGATTDFASRLFVGPKLQQQLEATAEGLVLTVDYGVLTALADPLFWLLERAYALLGNWGLAIIAVTFLIKLVFYPLTQMSGRSMAKMRKLAPRLKALQERFKDDKQALSQAMMELYRKEKANPAAGCLPLLIQMPFFFAFYWVLIESVEMRQAP
ncbi:MAG TPA: membrane protein insertase YidC, partial [Gammaproteobacteria bacterium]|nr:membrane protein insertase YidC [Gammaproteobacteria bacterium]